MLSTILGTWHLSLGLDKEGGDRSIRNSDRGALLTALLNSFLMRSLCMVTLLCNLLVYYFA